MDVVKEVRRTDLSVLLEGKAKERAEIQFTVVKGGTFVNKWSDRADGEAKRAPGYKTTDDGEEPKVCPHESTNRFES